MRCATCLRWLRGRVRGDRDRRRIAYGWRAGVRVFSYPVALDGRLAVPFTFIRIRTHFDTMHSLTSAPAESWPQLDSRPQACAHSSAPPPPVATPLVGAAPPPPATRAG
ncbi:hypothetical protein WK24_14855 [Burkholderia vietnamiensis]|nr:hypothetical protein WK24_14855 [Burkholderia vietnamiensis]